MTELIWHEHADAAAMASAAAAAFGAVARDAVQARGQALLALPGGSTPIAAITAFANAELDWPKLVIIPGDDRLVDTGSPLSNAAMLARLLGKTGARLVPLAGPSDDPAEAGRDADALLADLPWPPDLVALGIGNDGHTASLLPGPDLEAALTRDPAIRAIGVRPDPLPAEAPVPRVTLTAGALRAGRVLMILIAGASKRRVVEQAMAEGADSAFPVGRALAGLDRPVHIHWRPD
jgi:6-phosphogluconolactonase